MPAGLQVWDSLGRLRLDTSVRMATFVGSVSTGTSNGSLSVPAVAKGTPFFYVVPEAEVGGTYLLATPRWSGTTLIWEFLGGSGSTRASSKITYGYF